MVDSLGSYVAGIFESQGTIFFPKKSKSQKLRNITIAPKFRIVFHIVDLALAKTIQDALNMGTIKRMSNITAGFVEYQIRSFEGLWKIAEILNGKLRTPKIKLLQKLFNILNQRYKTRELFICKGLDLSCLSTNAWLAGFFENNCQFPIKLLHENEPEILTKWSMFRFSSVSCYFYFSMTQTEKEKENFFLLSVFEKIAKFMFAEVVFKKTSGKYIYECSTVNEQQEKNMKGNLNLFFYFDKFPLLSWKFHLMVPWLTVVRSFYKTGRFDGSVLLSCLEEMKQAKLKKQLVKTLPDKFTIPVDEYYFVTNAPHLRHLLYDHLHWRSCNFYNNNKLDWEHLEMFFYKFELEFNGKFDKIIVEEKPFVFRPEKPRKLTELEEFLQDVGDSDEFWGYYWSFKEKKEKGLVPPEYTLEDEVLDATGCRYLKDEEEEEIKRKQKSKSQSKSKAKAKNKLEKANLKKKEVKNSSKTTNSFKTKNVSKTENAAGLKSLDLQKQSSFAGEDYDEEDYDEEDYDEEDYDEEDYDEEDYDEENYDEENYDEENYDEEDDEIFISGETSEEDE